MPASPAKRHRHRDGKVMLFVIKVDLIAEIATLPALADDDDAGVVQHGLGWAFHGAYAQKHSRLRPAVRSHQEGAQGKSGKQPDDPVQAAQAMLALIASEQPPAHLLLGSDALGLVREKLAAYASQIDAWEQVTRSTDVDAG